MHTATFYKQAGREVHADSCRAAARRDLEERCAVERDREVIERERCGGCL